MAARRWADASFEDYSKWQVREGIRRPRRVSTVEAIVRAMANVNRETVDVRKDMWMPPAFTGGLTDYPLDAVMASSSINLTEFKVVRKATRSTRSNTWPLFDRLGRDKTGLIKSFSKNPPNHVAFEHILIMLSGVLDLNIAEVGAEAVLQHVLQTDAWQRVMAKAKPTTFQPAVRGFGDLIFLMVGYWAYVVTIGGNMIREGREAEMELYHSGDVLALAMTDFWFRNWKVKYLNNWNLPMTEDRLRYAYVQVTHGDLIDSDSDLYVVLPNAQGIMAEIVRRLQNGDLNYMDFHGNELETTPLPGPIIEDISDPVPETQFGEITVEELPLQPPKPAFQVTAPIDELDEYVPGVDSPRRQQRVQRDIMEVLFAMNEQVAVVPDEEEESEEDIIARLAAEANLLFTASSEEGTLIEATQSAMGTSPYPFQLGELGERVRQSLHLHLPAEHWSSLEAILTLVTEGLSRDVGVPVFEALLQDPDAIEFAVLRMLDPHAQYSPDWDPSSPDAVLTRNSLMMEVLFNGVSKGRLSAVADWLSKPLSRVSTDLTESDLNLIMQVSSYMVIRWAMLQMGKLRGEILYWQSDYRLQAERREIEEAVRQEYQTRERALYVEIDKLQRDFVDTQASIVGMLVEVGYLDAGHRPGTMAALMQTLNSALQSMRRENRRLNTLLQRPRRELTMTEGEVVSVLPAPVSAARDLHDMSTQIHAAEVADGTAQTTRVSVASWGGGPTGRSTTATMSVGTMMVMETSDKGTEMMLPWEARRQTKDTGTSTADFVVLISPDELPEVPTLDLRRVHNDSESSIGAQPRTPLDTPRSDRAVGYQPNDVGSDASGAIRPADPNDYVPAGWGGSVAGSSTDAVDGASDGTGSGSSGGPPPAPPPRPPAGAGAGPGRAPAGPGGAGPPRATQPPANLPPIHRRRIVTNHGNLAERVGPPPAAGQAYRNSIAYRALLSAQAGNPALIKDNATTWDPKLKMLRPKYKPGPKKGSEMAMRVAGRARAARRNAVPVQVMRNRPQPVRTELQRAREKALVAGLRSAQDCAVNEAMDIIGN